MSTRKDIKKLAEELSSYKTLLRMTGDLLKVSAATFNYHEPIKALQKLSGAKFVAINSYEDNGTLSVTRAIAGLPSAVQRASEILGFELVNHGWQIIPERKRHIEGGKLVRFNNIYEAATGELSKHSSMMLQKLFKIGSVYVIELTFSKNEQLGDIIFFMQNGKEIRNGDAIEIYAGQLGSLLDRLKTEKKLAESEAANRSIIEVIPDIIFVLDQNGTVLDVIASSEEELFQGKKRIVGKKIGEVLPEDRALQIYEAIGNALKTNTLQVIEYNLDVPAGNLWFEGRILPSGDTQVTALVRNITERKKAEEELKYSRDQYQSLIDNIPGVSYRCLYDKNWTMLYMSRDVDIITGYPSSDFIGNRVRSYASVVHSDDRKNDSIIQESIKSGKPWDIEYRVIHKDGSIRWVHEKARPVFGEEGKVKYIDGLFLDITARKEYEERIHYISFHDLLTGLYNRRFITEEMARLDLKRQLPLSIIMADLNGLKLINDTYGHDAGDELLVTTAAILKSVSRKEDVIARWGGDEFVIMLPQTDAEKVEKICKRIAERCRNSLVKEFPVSVAIGAATKTASQMTLSDLMKEAEDNMYKQKLTESRSTKNALLQGLLKTLAAKSYETEEHTRRMQLIATKIGEKLNLSEPELKRLDLAIILHDIGKINISEEILTKKGALTENEWKVIREHPETGFRIARATEDFSHVAEDILAHHENWDGSGYPQKLKGTEINLLARIIAIADAFDVMSNTRPYRKEMSSAEIISEFKYCSGRQFDPELVDLFLTILTNNSCNNMPSPS